MNAFVGIRIWQLGGLGLCKAADSLSTLGDVREASLGEWALADRRHRKGKMLQKRGLLQDLPESPASAKACAVHNQSIACPAGRCRLHKNVL